MKRTIALLFCIAALGGCSKPTDAVIPSDMATWDKELAPHLKKLSDEDREKVAGYLMRAKVGEVFGGKGMPPGTTIGQALEDQKNGKLSKRRNVLRKRLSRRSSNKKELQRLNNSIKPSP